MKDVAEYAMFSRREMDRRYALAREGMAARGLDALLVTGEENFQYFTGTSASLALHHSLTRPNVLILPCRGEPVVHRPAGQAPGWPIRTRARHAAHRAAERQSA